MLLAGLLLALQSAAFFGHSAYRVYLDPLLIVLASSLATAWLPVALRLVRRDMISDSASRESAHVDPR